MSRGAIVTISGLLAVVVAVAPLFVAPSPHFPPPID